MDLEGAFIAGTLICSQAKAQWNMQASPVKTNLTAVSFKGSRLGYAAGEKGTLLITNDGGKIGFS